ncbi:MAG: hypothetical protein ACFE8N_06470, partial [Promethearchaeota archaeon]
NLYFEYIKIKNENKKKLEFIMVNQILILILLSFGLLLVSIIIGFIGIIKEYKKKSGNYFLFILLIDIAIMFLIPVILGLIEDLSL